MSYRAKRRPRKGPGSAKTFKAVRISAAGHRRISREARRLGMSLSYTADLMAATWKPPRRLPT